MTSGQTWSTCSSARPCLVVHSNHTVTIEALAQPSADVREAVSGNTMLVRDGKVLPHTNKVRHPRTVVGLNAERTKLTILVADGRRPGVAMGMSYDELAAEMLRLGCHEALNLDGGGSPVLAVREAATGKFRILHAPTDGRERAVANVLGVSVAPAE